MVGTIGCAVRVQALWYGAAWAFAMASIAGGAALGVVTGYLGATVQNAGIPMSNWVSGGLAALLSAAAFAERLFRRLPRAPSLKRQVNSAAWSRKGPLRASVIWGAELGIAVTTRGMSWLTWAMVAWIVVLESPSIGLIAGCAFGAARGLQVPISVMADDPVGQASSIGRIFTRRGVRATSPQPRISSRIGTGLSSNTDIRGG